MTDRLKQAATTKIPHVLMSENRIDDSVIDDERDDPHPETVPFTHLNFRRVVDRECVNV